MKKFLIVSFLLLMVALVATVVVYWYLNAHMLSPSVLSDFTDKNIEEATSTVMESEGVSNLQDAAAEIQSKSPAFTIPPEGIALSSLPLTDAQKKALTTASVDVQSFVLTATMLECGARTIGIERIAALADGQAPTFLEITKLIPCLTAE